jgi:hypothetical protein
VCEPIANSIIDATPRSNASQLLGPPGLAAMEGGKDAADTMQ